MKNSVGINADLLPRASMRSGVAILLQRFANKSVRRSPSSARKIKRLAGAALRQYRKLPRNRPLERGARLVYEGLTIPKAARYIKRHPSTLRRYLHKTRQARKKRGRLLVPRYRATYWLRIFSEGSFIRVHLDRAASKLAGEFMEAVGEARRLNDRSVIAPYEGRGVTDVDGVFYPFETRMNILYRLHLEQAAESFDLEYEIEVG